MKAVRIYQYGGPAVLKYETDAPQPDVGPDAILVETVATSVNPIDWKIRSGARQKDFPLELPAILGKDLSGVVRLVGANVTNLKPGDGVLALADATYAEFVTLPAAAATLLPDGLDPVDAAAIPLVSLTGDQLVKFAAGAATGETVLVSGALGSVGRAAVHSAKKLGAKVIAAVRGRQVAEAQALDVFQVVALDDDVALKKLEPVDCVADTVGGETAVKLLGCLKPHGRFGYASVLPESAAANYPNVEIRPDPAALSEFATDVRDGAFVLPISRRMALSEAGGAHERLEKGGGGKIVLTV